MMSQRDVYFSEICSEIEPFLKPGSLLNYPTERFGFFRNCLFDSVHGGN